MVGSVAPPSARSHGVDRFYNPPALRRQLQLLQQQQQQQQQQQKRRERQQEQQPQVQLERPAKLKTKVAAAVAAAQAQIEVGEAESRVDSDDSSSRPSVSASPSPPPRPPPSAGNLDRFLESTTPVVPAQYLRKASSRCKRNGETMKVHPCFSLGDLWESFREWSAYGAGVPLTLNGGDSVIQYYVPYLSGIQLYVDSSRHRLRCRHPGEDCNVDLYRDSNGGGNSECEADRLSEHVCDVGGIMQITDRINGILLGDKHKTGQEGSSSIDIEAYNTSGVLTFEYLERESPYGREPLSDKISLLARQFPELKTYDSCDLLPTSWIAVAWYPIYRIPTGPTLRDLDASFLTFHTLSTLPRDINDHPDLSAWSIGRICNAVGNLATLPLSIFGLASYKFRGPVWTPSGLQEQEQVSSLLQAADNWLRYLKVDHPDFRFFLSHNDTYQR